MESHCPVARPQVFPRRRLPDSTFWRSLLFSVGFWKQQPHSGIFLRALLHLIYPWTNVNPKMQISGNLSFFSQNGSSWKHMKVQRKGNLPQPSPSSHPRLGCFGTPCWSHLLGTSLVRKDYPPHDTSTVVTSRCCCCWFPMTPNVCGWKHQYKRINWRSSLGILIITSSLPQWFLFFPKKKRVGKNIDVNSDF